MHAIFIKLGQRQINLFTSVRYQILILLFIFCSSIFFSGCTRCGYKSGEMSNEDFIKIEVRTSGEIALYAIQNGHPSNPLDVMKINSRIKTEVCNKYGYSEDDLEKKRIQILDDRSLQWIQYNVNVLSANISPIPRNDNEWDNFFTKNERLLKKN